MEAIRILTLNVKGLNTPEKRKVLLNDLKRFKVDIAFIQETHFRDDKLPILKNRFYPISYHATNKESKSKGVSIIIAQNVPWNYEQISKGPQWKIIIFKGKYSKS